MKVLPFNNATSTVVCGEDYKQQILDRASGEYEREALEFLFDTDSCLTLVCLGRKSMPWDAEGITRNCVHFTLCRGAISYSGEFGLSLNDSKKGKQYPSAYDILTCMNPCMSSDNLDDFASDMGCEKPTEAIRLFDACKKESAALLAMYDDNELERLSDIQ